MDNQELVMETTHGRKGKCKTEFKAVVNKVLVTGVVLATLMTSTVTPALAATNYDSYLQNSSAITQVDSSYNLENSIISIKNTINAINEMRLHGSVSDEDIASLANQLYALEKAVSMNGSEVTNEIVSIINEAEKAVDGLDNKGKVTVAVAVVRATLGIDDTVIVKDRKTGNIENVTLSDIQGHWGQTYIQAMANKGSIKGYEDGTFKPDKTISKSEFLAIAIRSTFPDYQKVSDVNWWEGEYRTALEKNIIVETEIARTEMDEPITREEMTMIMVRCVEANGEYLNAYYDGVKGVVRDYSKIGTYYRTDVVKAYTAGLIQGKDGDKFDPQGSATRAEAATVLYRLENKDARNKPDFDFRYKEDTSTGVVEDLSQPITIQEGQERTNRLAKEGDTVIKADGTQVVLKKGPNGILGEGQGVAPDLNLLYKVEGDNTFRVLDGVKFGGGAKLDWRNSLGITVVSDTYYVHPLTGEGHWGTEWSVIANKSYTELTNAGKVGKYEGEVSEDKQSVWDATIEDWLPLYCNGDYLK